MYDEMVLESSGTTARLLNESWAASVNRYLTRVKSCVAFTPEKGREALLKTLKRVRPGTYWHCMRVARISREIGHALKLDDRRMSDLSEAGMLHDVGKIFVPEWILSCPRKPTRAEFFILRRHPTLGAMLLACFGVSQELCIRTQHHHERWDGKGYPHRLGSSDIPFMARIVQIGDAYDAMVSKRSYRKPISRECACRELWKNSGTQFDPRIVEAFLDTFPPSVLSGHSSRVMRSGPPAQKWGNA